MIFDVMFGDADKYIEQMDRHERYWDYVESIINQRGCSEAEAEKIIEQQTRSDQEDRAESRYYG